MIREWDEFRAYTEPVTYTADGKRDSTYLGRFTFDTLLDFEGLARVLTILARGYLFHLPSDRLTDDPRSSLPHAREALCAWCSLPDGKKKRSATDWQYPVSFPELHEKFPALVSESGEGWFYHHVHQAAAFAKAHPELVSKSAQANCGKLRKGFDKAWENKLRQLQTPIFSPGTKGQWLLRFDDVLADALELGPLRQQRVIFSPGLQEKIAAIVPKCPAAVLKTLIAYYAANRPEDSDWVVLPVSGFDAYFGSTTFGRKYLRAIPPEIIQRDDSGFGVSRYRVAEEFLELEIMLEPLGE